MSTRMDRSRPTSSAYGAAPTFRRARQADATAIAELHADSWRRHYRGAYSDEFLDGDVRADRLAVWEARLGVVDPRAVTVLAETADGLAGFAHLGLDDDRRWGALLDNLHVADAHQRRGIGSILLARAARAVDGLDRGLYLWVQEQNAVARAFYAAHGAECVGRAPIGPPGGVAGRLVGEPCKLRLAWAADRLPVAADARGGRR